MGGRPYIVVSVLLVVGACGGKTETVSGLEAGPIGGTGGAIAQSSSTRAADSDGGTGLAVASAASPMAVGATVTTTTSPSTYGSVGAGGAIGAVGNVSDGSFVGAGGGFSGMTTTRNGGAGGSVGGGQGVAGTGGMIGAAGAPEATGLCADLCEVESEVDCDTFEGEYCQYYCELERDLVEEYYGCGAEHDRLLECLVGAGPDEMQCGPYGVEFGYLCYTEAYEVFLCAYNAIYGS